jgi:hypothetical protein
MAWIESHQQLEKHPKVIDLMCAMGWSLNETLGALHRFWWWCVDYAEDGDLRKHNDARIALAVGLNVDSGKHFVESMVQSCWIDRDPYFRVHDWWQYIGLFLQIKYKHNPSSWKRIRSKYKNGSNNRSKNSIPNLTKPNLTKQKRDFQKPTTDEVKTAFKSRGFPEANAEAFIDHHEARGWILSNGQRMKSLAGAVGTWIRNGQKFGTLITEGGKNDGWDRPFPA